MSQPLDGIRVLDLGQIYLGGYCGLLLAYLGADVVKVEPPWGDNVRSRTEGGHPPQFQLLNASKRGITLDLKSEEGRRALEDVVGDADVLVENYARGTMDDLGVGYDRLREVNPGLVYAHGSGYGDYGPYADRPAMDLAVQAMSGLMHATGFPDGPPVKAGAAVCDFLGGCHLALAVLGALFMRERTGEGQYVDVAMLDSTYPTMASPVSSWALDRDAPPRTGNQHSAYDIVPYNCYEVEDGHVIVICVSDRQWERLCRAMDRPELADDDRFDSNVSRANHREEIDAVVRAWAEGRERDGVVDRLLEAGVPCSPVRTVGEVVSDPQLDARGMLNYLPNRGEEGKGEIPVPGLPMEFSAADDPDVTAAPLLGEHTGEVLREAGYAAEEIRALRDGTVDRRDG